jgi:hypothetical protein
MVYQTHCNFSNFEPILNFRISLRYLRTLSWLRNLLLTDKDRPNGLNHIGCFLVQFANLLLRRLGGYLRLRFDLSAAFSKQHFACWTTRSLIEWFSSSKYLWWQFCWQCCSYCSYYHSEVGRTKRIQWETAEIPPDTDRTWWVFVERLSTFQWVANSN